MSRRKHAMAYSAILLLLVIPVAAEPLDCGPVTWALGLLVSDTDNFLSDLIEENCPADIQGSAQEASNESATNADATDASAMDASLTDASGTDAANTTLWSLGGRLRIAPDGEHVANFLAGSQVDVACGFEGPEFRGGTEWCQVTLYVHRKLLADAPPSTSAAAPAEAALAPTLGAVQWFEGQPSTGTCKDNLFHQRIYKGCVDGVSNEKMNDMVRNMSCNSATWAALGFQCRGRRCVRPGNAGTNCTP